LNPLLHVMVSCYKPGLPFQTALSFLSYLLSRQQTKR
jgi:hypothetical protein